VWALYNGSGVLLQLFTPLLISSIDRWDTKV